MEADQSLLARNYFEYRDADDRLLLLVSYGSNNGSDTSPNCLGII